LVLFFICADPSPAPAQVVEAVGVRALGLAGAFVALADDSTATWWNPAGLAAGPVVDLGLGWTSADTKGGFPAREGEGSWFAIGVKPFGIGYYRLQITNIPTAPDSAGREDGEAVVPVRSLSASQLGATFAHTLIAGLQVGTTLKYVRASGLASDMVTPAAAGPSQVLEQAASLDGGSAEGAFDLDVGVLVFQGPVRVGGVVRNILEPVLSGVTMSRMVRVGAAYEDLKVVTVPLTLSVDADLLTYGTTSGDRRVVAIGGEGWTNGRRLGIRAGARFNLVGAQERVFTTGASVAIRTGLYVDGQLAYGGASDEAGWGVAARASF
jgi:hypothetical protein